MSHILRTATLVATAFAAISQAKTIHFKPDYAQADADGSAEHPWPTLDKCFSQAVAGDVCLLEPGAYNLATPTGGTLGRIANSGTATSPIVMEARLPGTAFIGAWHELDWNETVAGSGIWTGTLRTPLAASIPALQGVWSSRLAQSGARLWYLDRRTILPEARWPRSESIFPRAAYMTSGWAATRYDRYTLPGLPPGTFSGAKVHGYRIEEEGAVVRTVGTRLSGDQVSIVNGMMADDDYTESGKRHRAWVSSHPDLLDASLDLGRWTWDHNNQNVRMVYHMDPDLTHFVLQVSAVGPDLAGRSHWTFRNLNFMGVVPVDDAATTGISYEGVSIQGVGLSEGIVDFLGSNSDLTGFVINGTGTSIDRSNFTLCPNSCVEILGSRVSVTNSSFTYSQLNAGAYSGTIHVKGSDIDVRNNYLSELGTSGIVFNRDADRVRISQNRIENWGRLAYSRAGGVSGFYHGTGSIEVDSNVILNQSVIDVPETDPLPGVGLNLMFGRNNVFAHHNIIDHAMVGIRLGGFYGNPEDNSQNNTIVSNTVGANTRYGWLRVQMASASPYSGSTIANNIFRTGCGYKEMEDYTFSEIVPASSTDPIAGGAIHHNLLPSVDPLFLDPTSSAWDFRLATGSPAIDAGVTYDLPGGIRVPYLGAAPDLGAIENGTNWTAGVKPENPGDPEDPEDPEDPPASGPFSMDDAALWTIPADEAVAVSTSDKNEGTGSFSVTPAGYKILESHPVTQDAVGGTSFVAFDFKISSLQANPWWVGAIQLYVECPSLNVWNQWIGQIELTGLAKDEWQTGRLAVPEYVAKQLQGASYSDLKVRVAVNLNPGSGALGLDNLRFLNN